MNKNNLQHLVYLIDDETTEVREEVLKGFTNYGTSLEEDLREFSDVLNPEKISLLQPVLEENRRKWLRINWGSWLKIKNEYEQLEYACSLISRFQRGLTYSDELPIILDAMAQKFRNYYPFGNELDLSYYLFQQNKFSGAKSDYYNPLNSNILHCIENKIGLPISLSIIYMLVGYRTGFTIDGCNFPGHFLSKITLDEETVLIDCFNGGRILYESDLTELLTKDFENVLPIIKRKTSTKLIIRRVVSNLINAYKEKNNQPNRYLFSELLQSTPWK